AKDLAMQVVLPELDGRIGALIVGHKADAVWHARTQCPLSTYAPDAGGIHRAVTLAKNWTRLRATPRAERRVAIVLANYPTRDGRLANGVGYDAPQSTVEILKALAAAGYSLDGAASPSPLEGEGARRADEGSSPLSPSPSGPLIRLGLRSSHLLPQGEKEEGGNALIDLLQHGPTNAHPERGQGIPFPLDR